MQATLNCSAWELTLTCPELAEHHPDIERISPEPP